MTKFGGLRIVVQKIYSKMRPASFTNTHDKVTDLVNHGMVYKYRNLNIFTIKHNFFMEQKNVNLCLR